MTSSLDIVQFWLDRMSDATINADWETYRTGVDLPLTYVTEGTNVTIATEEELRLGLDAFVATLRGQRVTDYIRIARAAEFVSPHLIAGGYETELLSHGNRVVAPYRSRVILRGKDGVWRAASVVNGLANTKWPLLTPEVPADSVDGGLP